MKKEGERERDREEGERGEGERGEGERGGRVSLIKPRTHGRHTVFIYISKKYFTTVDYISDVKSGQTFFLLDYMHGYNIASRDFAEALAVIKFCHRLGTTSTKQSMSYARMKQLVCQALEFN